MAEYDKYIKILNHIRTQVENDSDVCFILDLMIESLEERTKWNKWFWIASGLGMAVIIGLLIGRGLRPCPN
jgi:hypothetical protein